VFSPLTVSSVPFSSCSSLFSSPAPDWLSLVSSLAAFSSLRLVSSLLSASAVTSIVSAKTWENLAGGGSRLKVSASVNKSTVNRLSLFGI